MENLDKDYALAHYGVKGMKWGERKRVIKSARRDVAEQRKIVNQEYKQDRKALKGKYDYESRQSRQFAIGEARRKLTKIDLSEKAHIAGMQTRGEQVLNVMLKGPIGLIDNWATTKAMDISAAQEGHKDPSRKR